MAKKHTPRFLAIVEAARSEIAECEAADLRAMTEDGQPLVVLAYESAMNLKPGTWRARFTSAKA